MSIVNAKNATRCTVSSVHRCISQIGCWRIQESQKELRGDNIFDATGRRVGRINGSNIFDSVGRRVAQFDGRDIKDTSGRRISTIDNVRKDIDGIGGASLVAMWVFFVK